MTAHNRSLLVEAGAGSGKTAVMAGRIVLLLANGATTKSIAAVTFTEIAASELLARIRDFVDELLGGTVPRELHIALPVGLSAEQKSNLEKAASAINDMTCSTIHGFCQRLIKPYPVEANIDPGASVMDSAEAKIRFGDVVDVWLRQTLNSSEISLVSELVYRSPTEACGLITTLASALRDTRMVITANAEELAPRIVAFNKAVDAHRQFISDNEVQEAESIVDTSSFSTMAAVIAAALEDDSPTALVQVLTATAHHSLCTNQGAFRIYKRKGKWETAAKVAGFSKADGTLLNSQAQALHEACCQSWKDLLQVAAGRVLTDLLVAIKPITEQYRSYKRSAALLDFDDLLFSARALLRDHAPVRNALAGRYLYVLVDEFQDTDPLQAEIFWRLCGDPIPGADPLAWSKYQLRPGALFLVGDPKQAIYRFRGADVSAYIRARDAIRANNPEDVLSISTNFRSCASILSYVNECFAPHLSVDKGQPGFTNLEPFHLDHGEGPCVAALPIACAGQDGKAKVSVQRDSEAEAVAEMCLRLIGSQIIVDRKGNEHRACRPGDIALLAPGGTELWRYEEALEKRGIPVATQAGKGFYRRQEVQDLIAITRVLANTRDNLALLALLRGPLVGLTEEQLLDVVASQPKDPNYPDRTPKLHINLDPTLIEHELARDVIEKLQVIRRKINSTTPYQIVAEAIDVLRVRPLLLARHGGRAERQLANVDLFLSLAQPYGVRGLKAFARAMTVAWEGKLSFVEGRPDAQEEAVSLVTMHTSKGLEWSIVVPINTMTAGIGTSHLIVDKNTQRLFLPIMGVNPAGYEDAKSAETAELERERIRLWYVAATRARELLVLPKLDVKPEDHTWNALMDFHLERLPLIELDQHPEGFKIENADGVNAQTREVFAKEATAIVAASLKLRWTAPSRDEEPAGTLDAVVLPQIVLNDEMEPLVEGSLQGGRERGLIIHKLLEEVLLGEVVDNPASLVTRAFELITQLGREPEADAAIGLSANELGEVVAKTLALPEIVAMRPRLIPELPVYGRRSEDDVEIAVGGVVDALCLGADGDPEVVIDWKSDVNPCATTVEHYCSQVRQYLDITGALRGLIVFVTTGQIVPVFSSVSAELGSR